MLQKHLNLKTSDKRQLRQSIPRTDWQGAHDLTKLASDAQALVSDLTPTEIRTAVHALRDEVALSSLPSTDMLLHRINGSEALTSESVIQILPGRVISVSKVEDTLIVRCHGQILEFHEPVASGVAFLLERQKMVMHEWVGLDAEQRQALASRLIHENIAELV